MWPAVLTAIAALAEVTLSDLVVTGSVVNGLVRMRTDELEGVTRRRVVGKVVFGNDVTRRLEVPGDVA